VAADLRPDRGLVAGLVGIGEELGQGDLEDGRQPAQRGDRGPRPAAFELGQEALAQPGLGGGVSQGSGAFGALGPQPGAEVGVERRWCGNVELPCV
jgi:hypothetical protein